MTSHQEELAKERTREAVRVKELKEQGLSNALIAKRMNISPATVKRRLEHD